MTLQVNHPLGRSVAGTAGEVQLFTYVYRPDSPVLERRHPVARRGGAATNCAGSYACHARAPRKKEARRRRPPRHDRQAWATTS
ncbi:hypothetical protein ABZ897_28500 [Nonomuraea sp. NPDC046802]|uniref:hypothetical protein n=1 Tax=Nonomuraea sp. NPDC046802 TaxID=3154919 RepID=UPI0033D8233F